MVPTGAAWGKKKVLKAVASPASTFSKYSTGNAQTLKAGGVPAGTDAPAGPSSSASVGAAAPGPVVGGDEAGAAELEGEEAVHGAMRAFHAAHYCPSNMALAVVSALPLKEALEPMVVERFSAIPRRRPPAAAASPGVFPWRAPPLFDPGALPRTVAAPPLRDLRRLALVWEVAPEPRDAKVAASSPGRLLGHLLGHEGPGSAFATLQDLGWATGLSAGYRVDQADAAAFQVSPLPPSFQLVPPFTLAFLSSSSFSFSSLFFSSSFSSFSSFPSSSSLPPLPRPLPSFFDLTFVFLLLLPPRCVRRVLTGLSSSSLWPYRCAWT